MFLKQVAIVGGGPAGAFAAAQLAGAGLQVAVFDEKLAWEKPCGGGLTDKALGRWPFLRNSAHERNWITHCELVSPRGRKVSFELDRRIAIFSRFTLNGLLLERAREAGARLIRERVIEIGGLPGEWNLKTKQASYQADFVVLASGARSAFRGQFSSPLTSENFMVAVGYYIPGSRHIVQIRFLEGLHGYLWVFPRRDHFSAGICGRMQGKSTAELRQMLDARLSEFGLGLKNATLYAHIIPSLVPSAFESTAFSGPGWAMVGDTAGFVDPITGEGLYYALRSAELMAQAILNHAPESYPTLVKEDFLSGLVQASRIADRFYRGEWMGSGVIERMIQLTARSRRFRDLMRDLFAGSQEYTDLKARLYGSLPLIAAEALVSTLWSSTKTSTPGTNAGMNSSSQAA
jgi:geranylgeranyl reductase family protein